MIVLNLNEASLPNTQGSAGSLSLNCSDCSVSVAAESQTLRIGVAAFRLSLLCKIVLPNSNLKELCHGPSIDRQNGKLSVVQSPVVGLQLVVRGFQDHVKIYTSEGRLGQ